MLPIVQWLGRYTSSAGGTGHMFVTRLSGMGPGVERVQLIHVLVRDDLTLELHARDEVAVLDGEILVQNDELLDLLPVVELGVELLDGALDQFACLGCAGWRRGTRP